MPQCCALFCCKNTIKHVQNTINSLSLILRSSTSRFRGVLDHLGLGFAFEFRISADWRVSQCFTRFAPICTEQLVAASSDLTMWVVPLKHAEIFCDSLMANCWTLGLWGFCGFSGWFASYASCGRFRQTYTNFHLKQMWPLDKNDKRVFPPFFTQVSQVTQREGESLLRSSAFGCDFRRQLLQALRKLRFLSLCEAVSL